MLLHFDSDIPPLLALIGIITFLTFILWHMERRAIQGVPICECVYIHENKFWLSSESCYLEQHGYEIRNEAEFLKLILSTCRRKLLAAPKFFGGAMNVCAPPPSLLERRLPT